MILLCAADRTFDRRGAFRQNTCKCHPRAVARRRRLRNGPRGETRGGARRKRCQSFSSVTHPIGGMRGASGTPSWRLVGVGPRFRQWRAAHFRADLPGVSRLPAGALRHPQAEPRRRPDADIASVSTQGAAPGRARNFSRRRPRGLGLRRGCPRLSPPPRSSRHHDASRSAPHRTRLPLCCIYSY